MAQEWSMLGLTACSQDSSHTAKRDGAWIRGTANEIFRAVVQSNERVVIKTVCLDCGRSSGALPAVILQAWGVTWESVKDVRLNSPRERQDYDPCSYKGCTTTPTEYHHFGPYNTFGADADNWPCLPLCREHHQNWHHTMDGYRWQKARVA
jgi:hypothetical protein